MKSVDWKKVKCLWEICWIEGTVIFCFHYFLDEFSFSLLYLVWIQNLVVMVGGGGGGGGRARVVIML